MASESSIGIVKTLMTWETVYSADSVEWCPIEPFFNIFVCGTYQLQKEDEDNNSQQDVAEKSSASQVKVGRIYLFFVNSKTTSLDPVQTIETSAVLDQKWCQHSINGSAYLGVVNAAGFLQIYQLLNKGDLYKLKLVTEFDISEGESKVLALSLDWSTGKEKSEEPRIAISDSAGNITVCVLQNGDSVVKHSSWNAHSFEAWICAFDYWDPSVIYTGGDDSCLRVYDLRCGSEAKLVNRRHEAGVTSLHSNSSQEHLLASGSYDEKLRLWDTRRFKSPVAEEALGGGIWRTKWDPIQHEVLLVACMYGGFRVVDSQHFSAALVVAEYNEHASIAYGADWCQDVSHFNKTPESSFSRTIATCSFYDCKLNVAEIKY